MSDKELIKQEIERLKHTSNAYDRSRFMLLEEIESFIDSLPEESTDEVNCTTKNEDLEEEIERCWKEMFPIGWSDSTLLTLTHEQHKALARHFSEWQKQKNLGSLQTEYEKGLFDMRDEMMKDAADSKITTDGNSIFPIIKYQLPLTYDCKIGDKVKIIIVKEEQQ